MAPKRQETLGYIGLFAVYILWGSTFLGIRMAVETIPPLIAALGRHAFGGGVLVLGLLAAGKWGKPKRREVRHALAIGMLTAGFSNGALMWTEVNVPSSYAAIAYTTMPLFILMMNWAAFQRVRPSSLDFIALPLGLTGSLLVVGTGEALGGGRIGSLDVAFLILSPFVWAYGSLLGKRLRMPENILVSSALQMLGGALFLGVMSLLHGDWARVAEGMISARSWWGLLYLAVGGSLFGYTAFAIAMRNLDPRIVGTYAFVNPIIAIILGYFTGEQVLRGSILTGAVLSIGSVSLTLLGARYRARRALAQAAPKP